MYGLRSWHCQNPADPRHVKISFNQVALQNNYEVLSLEALAAFQNPPCLQEGSRQVIRLIS